MPNEFKIKNGFFSEGNSNITGSLNVSAGITGSLLGTASYATQALSTSWGSIAGTLSNQTDLSSSLASKQSTLISGTNIKTINSQSLLGSGNLSVGGTTISQVVTSSLDQYRAPAGNTATRLFTAQLTGSQAGQTIDLDLLIYNEAGTVNPRLRVYLNSTPSLSGATQFDQTLTNITGSNSVLRFTRRFFLIKNAGDFYFFYGADFVGGLTDYVTGNSLSGTSVGAGFSSNYLMVTLDNSGSLLAATVKF